jgi:hypothetical protein
MKEVLMSYKVLISGVIDISGYVNSEISIADHKPFAGEFYSLPNISIDCININDFFNLNNEYSPLSSFEIEGRDIDIYKDERLIYRGIIKNITTKNNGSMANISVRSNFDDILNVSIPYLFLDEVTPAGAVKEICEIHGIEYDEQSIMGSDLVHKENGLILNITVTVDSVISISSLLSELAKCGFGSIYFTDNKLKYDIVSLNRSNPFLNPAITIYDSDIINIQKQAIEKNNYDSYKISWAGGVLTDGTGVNELSGFDYGAGRYIEILNPSGAVWLAEKWMEYHNSYKNQFSVDIKRDTVVEYIRLGGVIRILSEKMIISDRYFEIYEKSNTKNSTGLQLLEVYNES